MGKIPEWAIGPHTDVEPGVVVRLNDDGTIDEICVETCSVHVEQMDDGRYWMGLHWTDADGVARNQHVWFNRHGKHIFPTVCT
jgi:hypothetical protein